MDPRTLAKAALLIAATALLLWTVGRFHQNRELRGTFLETTAPTR